MRLSKVYMDIHGEQRYLGHVCMSKNKYDQLLYCVASVVCCYPVAQWYLEKDGCSSREIIDLTIECIVSAAGGVCLADEIRDMYWQRNDKGSEWLLGHGFD